MKKALATIFVILLFISSTCACVPQDIQENTIELSCGQILRIGKGDEVIISLTNAEGNIAWSCPEGIIKISPDNSTCSIKGTNIGITEIYAVYNDITYKASVVVSAFRFSFENSEMTAVMGENSDFDVKYTKNNDSDIYTFSSSCPHVADISDSGHITLHSAGETVITAESAVDLTYKVSARLMVYSSEARISTEKICLNPSQTYSLTANNAVTWSSADTSVASVKDGNVTANKEGKTVITVTTGTGHTGTCEVTVTSKKTETIDYTDSRISYIGRGFNGNGRYVFCNTSTGFSVSFFGTELSAHIFSADKPHISPDITASRLYVITDGNYSDAAVINIKEDENKLLVSGLEYGYHTVTLLKATEATYTNTALYSLTTDGIFGQAPHLPERKIEVYGDSISAGLEDLKIEGASDLSAGDDGVLAYGPVAARALLSQVNVSACSGIGLYLTHDDYDFTILQRYADVAAARDVYIDKEYASWDMSLYTPDVVVINLGTNDRGSIIEYTKAGFTAAYIQFIDNLRSVYGNDTVFILCEGAMTTDHAAIIKNISDNEENTYYLHFDMAKNGHPSKTEHSRYAQKLEALLRDIMGW